MVGSLKLDIDLEGYDVSKPKIRFNRAPKGRLCKYFEQGQVLSPLLDLKKRWEDKEYRLDVHFRPDNRIDFYWGLTKLSTLKWLVRPDLLRVEADKAHKESYRKKHSKECAELFCAHSPTDDFCERLRQYLLDVDVHPRHVEKEGEVHPPVALAGRVEVDERQC